MEITRIEVDEVLELRITGRLDAYWADHLTAALEDALRQGADRIRLDMAEVGYMSSVGIRVLLRFYKQVQRLNGAFTVTNPSVAVKSVLELAGLESMLVAGAAAALQSAAAEDDRGTRVVRGGVSFDVFDLAPGAKLEAHLIGEPGQLLTGGFAAQQCRALRAAESTVALGLGALGRDFDDCSGRFGEFLAVAGAAAYLPADGTNVADYLTATGAFVPELRVLYAIACEGSFARLARFEAAVDSAGHTPPVGLETLVDSALTFAEADAAAIVIVAETSGLMGAALRRSPTGGGASFAFDLPAVRDWLWFTPERAFARSLALVVGIVARTEIPGLGPFVRPLGKAPWPAGHLHAAAFSYRPLRRGRIDLRTTVASLFEGEQLQTVLHLLHDDRPIVGAGESEFVRGACWIGPLAGVTAEGR